MTQDERWNAILNMTNRDGSELHFRLGFAGACIGCDNEKAVQSVFDELAYQEYLKKKAEFLLPLRDSKGRFKSNNYGN